MNSEIQIKQLKDCVAYLETIAQSSAHEILTEYMHVGTTRRWVQCKSVIYKLL